VGPEPNAVRALHDAVAHDADLTVASARPPGTSRAELDRMVADVLAKLDVGPNDSVLDIGCGVGVVGLPVAERASSYVGVDFSSSALEAFAERVQRSPARDKVSLVTWDVLRDPIAELEGRGPFDRVLVYASFQYVADAQEAVTFLERTVSLLRPGGLALIGNLPLAELADDVARLRGGSPVRRVARGLGWIMRDRSPIPRPTRWKAHAVVSSMSRAARTRAQRAAGPAVPGDHLHTLRHDEIERWLREVATPCTHEWQLPVIGTPMYLDRADLLVQRQPDGRTPEEGGETGGAAPAPRPRVAKVAGLRLSVPDDLEIRSLSDPSDSDAVRQFLAASPDAVLHHQPEWLDFVRSRNGRADLVMLEKSGHPLVALPVHPAGRRSIAIGYSGLVFPPSAREATHKRSIRALRSLLDANPHLALSGIQSVQAPAYDDRDRTELLAWQIEAEQLTGRPMWSRIIVRPPEADVDPVDEDLGFAGYDAKLRNQIRQARRNGIVTTCQSITDDRGREQFYEEFAAVHLESWTRTKLRPRSFEFWCDLSRAVRAAGGQDIAVMAYDGGGRPVAGVTCHVFRSRAVYQAGASRAAGQEARANHLCLHTAIGACFAEGAGVFELGRFSASEPAAKERQVTGYKSQFGGRVVRLTTVATPRSRTRELDHLAFRARRKARVLVGAEPIYL
jgi:SAM-dependent methyltransferase